MKRLASLLLLATVMAADCPGGDDSTGPGATIAGTWTLQTVGGSSLPAQYQEDDLTIQVTAGSIVINANGTFTYSETNNVDGAHGVSGTWVAAGAANTYTFTPSDEDGYGTGVFAGNNMTLTISDGGPVRTYQRP